MAPRATGLASSLLAFSNHALEVYPHGRSLGKPARLTPLPEVTGPRWGGPLLKLA